MYIVKDSHDMTLIYRLFMIFNFKDDMLFIKILNILQQFACKDQKKKY